MIAEADKKWVNGPDADRPDIWFQLWRSYNSVDEHGDLIIIKEIVPGIEDYGLIQEVTSENDWKVKWTGLDQTTIGGVAYIFFVREGTFDGTTFTEGAPENYSADEGDDLAVTNTYVIPDEEALQINEL